MTTPASNVRDPEVRIQRICDWCHQIDTDPHIHVLQADGTTLSGHHDCAAAAGNAKAAQIVSAFEADPTPDILTFLQNGGADPYASPSGTATTPDDQEDVDNSAIQNAPGNEADVPASSNGGSSSTSTSTSTAPDA